MSNYSNLHKIAHCNANKSQELIECCDAVYQVLTDSNVGFSAALERLYYLIISYEGLELKAKRGIIPSRDPLKLDLEHRILKSLTLINRKMTKDKYNDDTVLFILKWSFKVLGQVKENQKIISIVNKMLTYSADRVYSANQELYIDKVFEIYSKECSNSSDTTNLVRVLTPYPSLTSCLVKRSFNAYHNKDSASVIYKNVISELSKFNCNLVSSAVMDLLEEDTLVNQKVGFVLSVLCSIPSLQPLSMMLLNESNVFKRLMSGSRNVLSSAMVDDLAKLFMHSQINSYSTVMSLLEQESEPSALGPSLLQKILHNLELAVYGVTETSADKTISFVENMSSQEDIQMFCKCLTYQEPSKHPYILKCLHIISIYKEVCVAKTVVSELLLTQPLDRFEALLDKLKGVYPTICFDCFKAMVLKIEDLAGNQQELLYFFENSEKLKLFGHHSINSREMVSLVQVISNTDNYKLIMSVLRFLEPRAIDIADTVIIVDTLLEVFMAHVDKITDDVEVELLETISELKGNIVKWSPIKDSIRLTILNKLLVLLTSDPENGLVRFDDDETDESSLLSTLKSAVVESEDHVHQGKIRRRVKVVVERFSNVLAVQSVMNLLQSVISNSPKAGKELSTFLLDYLCPDVNLEAPWPELQLDKIKTAIERDLHILNNFQRNPLLWNILEEALSTKNSDLIVIIRALLFVLVSYWSSSRVSHCNEAPETCQITVTLLNLLSCVEWLPPPIINISQLIPVISPFETTNLLLEIVNHFKVHCPHMSPAPITKYQPSLKDAVCLIVQNNIEKVGVTAFLFGRWPGIASGGA